MTKCPLAPALAAKMIFDSQTSSDRYAQACCPSASGSATAGNIVPLSLSRIRCPR